MMKHYDDYIKEIKNLGRWLIKHAEDVVMTEDDYKNKLKNLTLYSRIALGEVSTQDISKEYLPIDDNDYIKDDDRNDYYVDGIRVPKSVVDKFEDNLVECTTWGDASKYDRRYASTGACDELEKQLHAYDVLGWCSNHDRQ